MGRNYLEHYGAKPSKLCMYEIVQVRLFLLTGEAESPGL